MQLNKLVSEFKWTDELVKEFAIVCTQGAYGDYRGCKKIEDKLNRFKERFITDKLGTKCSICEQMFTGYGNNAEPINDGRCCDSCNANVIWARLTSLTSD